MSWEPGCICHHHLRDQASYCLDCGAWTGKPGDLSLLTKRERAAYEWSLVKLHLKSKPPFPKTSQRYWECRREQRADAYPHLQAWALIREQERKLEQRDAA